MKVPRKRIEEVAEVIFSNVDKISIPGERSIRLCNYTNVYYNRHIRDGLDFMQGTATDREIERFKLRKGDVIITKDSEEADDIAIPAYVAEDIPDLICGYHLAIIRPKKGSLDGRYLSQLLQMHSTRHYFATLANGVTRYGLGTETISNAMLYFLSYPEQCKISDILCTWDEAAERLDALIAAKEHRKRGLTQMLLTGKKRLPGYKDKWQKFALGDLFSERVEIARTDLPLLSITADRGVIRRDELVKRDTSSEDKSKYLRITPGDIGYNTMRMWQGVSALSTLEGIVSPAYTICVPGKKIDGKFASYFFKLPHTISLFHRYSQGLVDDTLNLKFNNFSVIEVVIPPTVEEQKAVTQILEMSDCELDILRLKRDAIESQKRGLMQQLLTGKVRVKA